MTPRERSLLVGAVQLTLALLVAGKYAWDRATLPRVWVRSVPIDPDDPLRGRYVRLRIAAYDRSDGRSRVHLMIRGDSLIASGTGTGAGLAWRPAAPADSGQLVLDQSLAYYIPESAEDPSRLPPGSELWVLVSVPPDGLPRPLRLERRRRS